MTIRSTFHFWIFNKRQEPDLWTAAKRVEHVKEHKARERHGGVTWSDNVVSHLEHKQEEDSVLH